ncbi:MULTISPECIES: phosphatase PAP2 family protein [unclassified Pseudovibrio]|uniref:phosphatase PAP2 family protein n=1 Tax=unclassified Pseudovibrio TaxID=2627060 RepID=UPI0007AE992E|nr:MULTISPECIES: phosphatase PAP2 family protein [unclassified Pseudovibrio]KZL18427.1 phosphatidylglycerophosphatase B [Pseudovibrio sp. Ad37]KZL28615.1 phosphatidylglycerophosphatase B [Pseudovibrio sp. WM33]
MINDGSIDTLERPAQDVDQTRDKSCEAQPLKQEVSRATPYEKSYKEDAPREESSTPSIGERLIEALRVAGNNARQHFGQTSAILKNRRARSSVAAAALPPLLKPQNIAALLIGLCGLAMVFLDHSSPIWARKLPVAYHDIFEVITDVGKSDWILFPTGLWILAMIFGGWQRLPFRRKMAVSYLTIYGSYLFFVVAVSGLLAIVLKWNIGRARPTLFDEMGPMYFDFFAWEAKLSSLPSGHSTTAGALIVALALIAPRLRWLLAVVGLWIAASRVIVGAHYPSDVVAGIIIGGAFSYCCARWMARRRIGFSFDDKGGVQPVMSSISAALCLRSWRAARSDSFSPVQKQSETLRAD